MLTPPWWNTSFWCYFLWQQGWKPDVNSELKLNQDMSLDVNSNSDPHDHQLVPRSPPHTTESQRAGGKKALAIIYSSENSGLRLPKSILTLRPSLSNWFKMIWDLPVCQFPIWKNTSPHWRVGTSKNVCVCLWAQICLRAWVLDPTALTLPRPLGLFKKA